MSRVGYWAQHGSLVHYPVVVEHQLWQAPWPELACLHLYLLAGGDGLVNLVQWSCLPLTACAVSLIAQQLGAGRSGQQLAGLVTLTTPMAIAQASSTQTDLAASLWVSALVWSLLTHRGRSPWVAAGAVGAAAALCAATKATTALFAGPFLLAAGIVAWRGGLGRAPDRSPERARDDRRRLALSLGLAVGLGLILNAGYMTRNLGSYGHPLGPSSIRAGHTNQRHDPGALVSLAARNLSLHAPLLANPAVARATEAAVRGLHEALGLEVDDPATSLGSPYSLHGQRPTGEGYAGNPVQLLLFALTCGALAWRRDPADRRALVYGVGVILGALACVAVLRFQLWGSRLQLPGFLLAAALIGRVLGRAPANRVLLLGTLLLLSAAPMALFLHNRPLLRGPSFWRGILYLEVPYQTVFDGDREQRYFVSTWANLGPGQIAAADFLASRGCRDVGLVGLREEYALRPLLEARVEGRVRLRHLGVRNASSDIPAPDPFSPQALLVAEGVGEVSPVEGVRYAPAWSQGGLAVWLPSPN
jgi:hypothetical protein